LSYVWGQTGETCRRLLVSDLPCDNEYGDISIDSPGAPLAITVSDEIRVVQQLNEGLGETDTRLQLRYLWVDSLCIIQGPGQLSPQGQRQVSRQVEDLSRPHKDAKNSQLNQMDRIYGQATIVIVAAGGAEANGGIRGISDDRFRNPEQISREILPGVNVLLPVQYPPDYGKWDSRAWTLQEKLLSRKKLVFGENYASFHCQKQHVLREDMSAADAMNGPPSLEVFSPPTLVLDVKTKPRYRPGQLPIIYRGLTNPKDILAGVTGLLNALDSSDQSRSPAGDSTLSGLPERFIDLTLLWQPPAAAGVSLTRRAVSDRLPTGEGWDTARDDKVIQNHPGVRFEEPFLVSTYNNLSLRKVVSTIPNLEYEERYRPLVMWYRTKKRSVSTNASGRPKVPPKRLGGIPTAIIHSNSRSQSPSHPLRPVNGHGLGISFQDPSAETVFREQASHLRGGNDGIPLIPDGVSLRDYHLVCESQVATFRVKLVHKPRVEILWQMKQGNTGQEPSQRGGDQEGHEDETFQDFEAVKTHEIYEHEIRNEVKDVVGYVVPTNRHQKLNEMAFDFVPLSESQYWGNEKRVDVDDYPLYNVMMVEWDHSRKIAVRLGLGKVQKDAWLSGNPVLQTVILA
ncbi:putative conserved hypothetical protein, partial [Colletotrichum sublineola]